MSWSIINTTSLKRKKKTMGLNFSNKKKKILLLQEKKRVFIFYFLFFLFEFRQSYSVHKCGSYYHTNFLSPLFFLLHLLLSTHSTTVFTSLHFTLLSLSPRDDQNTSDLTTTKTSQKKENPN